MHHPLIAKIFSRVFKEVVNLVFVPRTGLRSQEKNKYLCTFDITVAVWPEPRGL